MEEEVLKKYEKAMEISSKVMEFAKGLVKENVKVLDLAESIESKIKELGGGIAFPVNVCINEIAAHYTPDSKDETVIKEGDLVKVDIGVHIDGYICDRAFTVFIGKEKHPLIKAAEKALKEALKVIKPGNKVFEVSEVVENILKEEGVNPVRNLCGHGLKRFITHAPPSIPNGKNSIQYEFEEGEAIAMEVFATDGTGWVKDSSPVLIYSLKEEKPVRIWEGRKILEKAREEFKGLPFAKRWVEGISPAKLEMALKQLVEVGALREYPILKEEGNGKVAQAEETVILK